MNLRRYFSIVLLLGSMLLVPSPLLAAARPHSANRECATCHIMWLTEFKQDDTETLIPYDPKPIEKTGKQDIASTEDICFSCHDGFVLESRFLWESGKHAHPVGQKPSDKITIPIVDGKNLFPLNEEGRMYCGTCHTAHGVDWDDKESAVFMRVRDVDGQLCMACHNDKTHGPKQGSHPLNKKLKKIPPALKTAGSKFGRKNEVVCQSCHNPHAAAEKKLLRVKNANSELCGQCHTDRYSHSMQQAAKMQTHPVNVEFKTATVPEELVKAGAKIPGGKYIICQSCHRPHDSPTTSGILVKDNNQGQLCQTCHVDKKTVLNSKHDMNLVDEESENIRKQKVKDHGACSACHVPHKGEGAKMWARRIDDKLEPMAALCLSCHREEGLAEKHTVGKFSHPVGVKIKRLGHSVPLPTFSEKGVKWQDVIEGRVSCASCHDPHQWDPKDKNHKAEPGDKGNNTNRFLRIANGSDADLCKTCHLDKLNIAGTKHDMRLMAPEAVNTLGQTVKESGVCGVCHLVHNANGNKLWARAKLDEQGTGYVACIGCHNENGLAKKKTLGHYSHPLNVSVKRLGINVKNRHWTSKDNENFTELPLYDKKGLAANNDGHVGCGTCHDPHNWKAKTSLEKEVNQDVRKIEGNANSSFLRIPDNGQSSLCVNCHRDKKTVFLTKHDLSDQEVMHQVPEQSDDDETKIISQRQVTGACMHCHTPHNAGENALWGRKPGKGKSPIEKLCTSCHQQGEVAGKKIPGNHTHPVGVSIGNLKPDKFIPLFDSEGNREDYQFIVDCASCHNPHQWDPENVLNRSPEIMAEEGTTTNSFLRDTANDNSKLCIRCHQDKKAIGGTDHDFDKSARNVLGQTRDVSGMCGQCHVPHHGDSKDYLWAQTLGKGQDPIEQRCRSCHAEGKAASKKAPEVAQHPRQIKVWSTKLRKIFRQQDKLPDIKVFNKKGRRATVGAITCASCHNPHQWQAIHQHQGDKKKNIEGNVLNSFLRNNDTRNIVCADCHDKDGLYRYKYFHSENTHPAEIKKRTKNTSAK